MARPLQGPAQDGTAGDCLHLETLPRAARLQLQPWPGYRAGHAGSGDRGVFLAAPSPESLALISLQKRLCGEAPSKRAELGKGL